MLSLRNLARSAPRSAARFSAQAVRPQASLRQMVAFQPTWTASVPKLTASFAMSAVRRKAAVSAELVAKIQSEISMEESVKDDEDLSTNIKEYLESSPFEIEDKEGNQEVVLTRTYNNENIRITFTTADLNNNNPDEDFSDDSAMYDDADVDVQSGGANSKGAVIQGRTADGNIRVAPDNRNSATDREEGEEEYDNEDLPQGFPVHTTIRIERPGKGALVIDATAQDGDFLIEDLYYFPNSELADASTAEKDWARRTLYTGPPFNNLDEDLQILLEKYLEERDINTRLAIFIPDYVDHKEQKEYIRWLNNLKNFVE